jgi:hypothetical protein
MSVTHLRAPPGMFAFMMYGVMHLPRSLQRGDSARLVCSVPFDQAARFVSAVSRYYKKCACVTAC